MRALMNMIKDRRGVTSIEYALIASLISVAGIAGYHALGSKVQSNFNNLDQTLGNTI